MFLADCHTHSVYSFDGRDSPERLAEAAASRGLAALTVTDHCDMPPAGGDPYYLAAENRRQAHFKALAGAAKGLDILYGLELGQPHQSPAEAQGLLNRHDYDFVIGSVHTLSDGRDIYQTDYTDFSVCQNVLELYFTDIQKMLAFGNFDSLGHLDYPLRVMGQIRPDPTLRDYREQIAPILKELVRQGKGLEINAKGCRSWLGRPGPDEWILKLFKDYGGTILTAGSDAHAAQNCGQGLEQALALARAAGFDQIALFRRRKPEFHWI